MYNHKQIYQALNIDKDKIGKNNWLVIIDKFITSQPMKVQVVNRLKFFLLV